MLVRAKAPHKVVKAFTGRRVTTEWLPVPDGCEEEAKRLASSGFVEIQEQTEEKPEPVAFLQVELETEPEPSPDFDFSVFPVTKLRQIAKDRSVAGYGQMNKAQLVKALNE